VLAGGLALRVWGIGQGLPYAYNSDEADHFVPRAIAMFGHDLDPHYFANPPGFTYLLHFLFVVWFGGRAGVEHAYLLDPTHVYVLARATAALLGTVALWLLYLVGARLFGRGIGLLAAALEAVAFLPVFYAHLALNDVPTLAPLTLSLLGTAGVLRKGRLVDYLLAGVGLGLACATKYTAGIVLLPLLAAAATRFLERERSARTGRRSARRRSARGAGADGPEARRWAAAVDPLLGIGLAGLVAALAFLLANPYSILDYQSFHHELVRQSSLSAEAQGKLGAPKGGGLAYYLWALTWGLGWVPALASLGGAVSVWRYGGAGTGRKLGWLLVPAPLVYLAFMSVQGRYFGRWLMPILPILCLLAAVFAVQLASASARLARSLQLRLGRRDRDAGAEGAAPARLRMAILVVLVTALLAQGLYHSVHSGMVLARADTRNLTRAWMVAHVPVGTPIVLEPVAPASWVRESGPPASHTRSGDRWIKYTSLISRISPDGALEPKTERVVPIEDYERTLGPSLIGFYESHGYCWVVSGSTESGRAFADPKAVPLAIAYYRSLAKRGELVFRASPYAAGRRPVAFNFDWSFDYYPLAYERPGPEMTVYRLHGGRCT
jgi:4-amino-4-deoxy-L-arabinose transferase-like glycosyltransferase